MRDMGVRINKELLNDGGYHPQDISTFVFGNMGIGGKVVGDGGEVGVDIARHSGIDAHIIPRTGSSNIGATAFTSLEELLYTPTPKHTILQFGEYMYPEESQILEEMTRDLDEPQTPEQIRERGEYIMENMKGWLKKVGREQTNHNIQRIASVIDPNEREFYGLTMVALGDLVMRRIAYEAGLTKKHFREIILPALALKKQRNAQFVPAAQFYGKKLSLDGYQNPKSISGRMITPLFNLSDVVPQSSGEYGVLVSTELPRRPKNGRIVRVTGWGQGGDFRAVGDREGSITFPRSIYQAMWDLCKKNGLSINDLRNTDAKFIHDAFPSIEWAFLAMMGYEPAEIVNILASGESNPLGGLSWQGHALGGSGLLQVALAYSLMTHNDKYIKSPELLSKEYKSLLTTSVGAILTNIMMIYLESVRKGERFTSYESRHFNEEAFKSFIGDYNEKAAEYMKKYRRFLRQDQGRVISYTKTKKGWVNLIQMNDKKIFALSDDELELDAKVVVDYNPKKQNKIKKVIGRGWIDNLFLYKIPKPSEELTRALNFWQNKLYTKQIYGPPRKPA